jgi:hypothetical protein
MSRGVKAYGLSGEKGLIGIGTLYASKRKYRQISHSSSISCGEYRAGPFAVLVEGAKGVLTMSITRRGADEKSGGFAKQQTDRATWQTR